MALCGTCLFETKFLLRTLNNCIFV
ncbi:unnamed protein product, partial [Rotaria socialis]